MASIDIVRLPSLPDVLRWAIEKCADGHDEAALADAVAHEPVLAARVLALGRAGRANGGGDHDSRTRLDVRKAALGAGGAVLHALVLRAATDWLRGAAGWPGNGAALAAFWAHSVHCAQLARALAEVTRYAHPEEAYAAGLLHDLGMPALMAHSPAVYRSLLASSVSEAHLLGKEAESLGFGHAEAGEALAGQLDLPGHVCDALLLQHVAEEELAGTHMLVRILWVAEALSDPSAPSSGEERFARLLGTGKAEIAHAAHLAAQRTRESAEKLGVPLAGAALWAPLPGAEAPGAAAPAGALSESERDSRSRAALLDAVLQRATLQDAPRLLLECDEDRAALTRARALSAAVFGLKGVVAFFHDSAKNDLSGWRIGEERLTDAELRIPARAQTSIVAQAWTNREPVTVTPEQGVRLRGVDLQLARLLGVQGLAALPLAGASGVFGVLVFGIGRDQAARIARERGALSRLAELAGLALAKIRGAAERQRIREDEAADRMGLAVRRMVHEARNPLSILKTQLELLRERVRSATPIDRDIQILKEEIDRVGGILARLARVEALAEPARAPFNVNRAIQDLLALYREPLFAERGITVRLDLPPQPPEIVADPDGVKQVLVNLWKNASEAMPRGGQLQIAVADRVNYEGRLMVEISIADTGSGISPESLEGVFAQRPERARESGRGFGLSNSYAIVRQCGGHIMCRSLAGRGTTFTLLLPRAEPGAPPAA